MPQRHVYNFGGGKADGRGEMKDILGGKGANLAEMTNLGVPVPAGFTISTRVCTYYMEHDSTFPDGLVEEVDAAIAKVGSEMRREFGGSISPLLLSVRSGARVSMPGMMDSVLNIGMNDTTAASIIAKTGTDRFVYDSYRRLIQMYSDVVMDVPMAEFNALIDACKKKKGVWHDTDLTAGDLKDLAGEFKEKVKELSGKEFPDDPHEQLWGAIRAVFDSWNIPRAIAYRKLNEWARAAPPASPSRETRPPGRRSSTASGCPMLRARTSCRVSGRPSPSIWPRRSTTMGSRSRRPCPRSMWSSIPSVRDSSCTTPTRRISSSRFRPASSGCSRHGPGSAPPRRPSASQLRWKQRA
jgi:hypothetical protein